MGIISTRNQPCLDQVNCKSSDARQVYESGDSFCFSCSTYFPSENTVKKEIKKESTKMSTYTMEDVSKLPTRGFKERKIRAETCEHYKVKVGYNSDGDISDHFYPYTNGYKHRKLPKSFSWVGTAGGLFGQDVFQGGGKRLVITEGELDAMSCAQAMYDKYKRWYPAISLPSASGTAQLLENREWITSFNEVVLCFDNDAAGQEATKKAITIIGVEKVKIWKPPEKDASDVLVKHGAETLNQCIWDAMAWSPAGIISKEEIWKQIVERSKLPSVPYPPCLEGLNTKLKGMRLGEITLFISGTGSGKSTVTREIELNLLEVTDSKIGIISLEESPGETGLKLASMQLKKNPADAEIPEDELKIGFDEVFKDDRLVVLDHQGSIKDDSIVNQLEYMCLSGCKYLVIDHITILVSEGSEGLTGNEAIDKVMGDLLRLVKRHDVWVGLVSHLRKVPNGSKAFEEGKMPTLDDIRGSGSIKQISFDVVAFARNMTAPDEVKRNTIEMSVLKARTTALTGPVNGAVYDYKTGRLEAAPSVEDSADMF